MLQSIEETISKHFIPAIFKMSLSTQGMKQGSMVICNPCVDTATLHKASIDANQLLIESLLTNCELSTQTQDHRLTVMAA